MSLFLSPLFPAVYSVSSELILPCPCPNDAQCIHPCCFWFWGLKLSGTDYSGRLVTGRLLREEAGSQSEKPILTHLPVSLLPSPAAHFTQLAAAPGLKGRKPSPTVLKMMWLCPTQLGFTLTSSHPLSLAPNGGVGSRLPCLALSLATEKILKGQKHWSASTIFLLYSVLPSLCDSTFP